MKWVCGACIWPAITTSTVPRGTAARKGVITFPDRHHPHRAAAGAGGWYRCKVNTRARQDRVAALRQCGGTRDRVLLCASTMRISTACCLLRVEIREQPGELRRGRAAAQTGELALRPASQQR